VQPGQGADVAVGDTVQLRKPHPCGSLQWKVVRIGADIGLVCAGCGRRVMLPRSEFAKRLRRVLSRGEAAEPDAGPAPDRHAASTGGSAAG
jgi:hypothetical protein